MKQFATFIIGFSVWFLKIESNPLQNLLNLQSLKFFCFMVAKIMQTPFTDVSGQHGRHVYRGQRRVKALRKLLHAVLLIFIWIFILKNYNVIEWQEIFSFNIFPINKRAYLCRMLSKRGRKSLCSRGSRNAVLLTRLRCVEFVFKMSLKRASKIWNFSSLLSVRNSE